MNSKMLSGMLIRVVVIVVSSFMLLSNCSEPLGPAAAPPEDYFYGSLTDSRDGKSYRTVKIGNKTWMAENLNYLTDSSWCYGNQSSNCAKYGRLYTWNAAMSVCPSGWHLPSDAEWTALTDYVGYESKLMSTSGWNSGGIGTNDYGFSALPGGRRNTDGSFNYAGSNGSWWSATDIRKDSECSRYMYYIYVESYEYTCRDVKNYGFSVRCVR